MVTSPAKAVDLNAACGNAAPESHKTPRSHLHAEMIVTLHVVTLMKIKKIALYVTIAAVRNDDVDLLGSKCSPRVSFNVTLLCCGLLFPLLSCAEYGPGPRAALG